MSSPPREAERVETDQQSAVCPIVIAPEQIGSKWRLIVLSALVEGEARFNELKRSTGANARTLSRVLDDLEEASLVNRRVEDRPLATYYSLTEKGEALCPVFSELESWARKYVDLSHASRRLSDRVFPGVGRFPRWNFLGTAANQGHAL